MRRIVPWLLVGAASAPLARSQGPSLAERSALFDQFSSAPSLVRSERVRARWLDDGSSLWYRDGATSMFIDPAEGTPRRATRADRQREVRAESEQRGGAFHAPRSERRAFNEGGDLKAAGGDLGAGIALTDDAQDDVFWSLDAGAWSPDGSMLCALRRDGREVHHLPIVDYLAAVETVRHVPYLKTGTPLHRNTLAVFHLPEGRRTDIELGGEDLVDDDELYVYPLGWRADSSELLFLRLNREATRLDLMAADPESGASRAIVTETSETFVGGLDFITGGWRGTFTPVPGTDRFLWLSERDGWRHVYQYDYAGTLVGRLTRGEFPVLSVAGVDAERGRAFVMANAESRPYDTHLYRVDLAADPGDEPSDEPSDEPGDLVRLTEGSGEHEVQLSPSKLFFVDTHSSLDRPPVSELRDVEGTRIRELSRADVSALDEIGWTPPEPFTVKAADGATELHGVLFRPVYFDPDVRYPVIDLIYSGPFMTIVPNDFGSRAPHARRAQALAQLGFVVFLVDPRGTTERGKAFQDASYGRIGTIEIPDHVATLRQLAAERPYMDTERVGVYGFSWGGYFALRAMLTAPDVFHVGVAGAPGELTEAAPINEPYMRTPANNPEGYAAGLNAPLAGNLKGELLIVHGTADVNAPFSTSMRMVAALIEADRPFDLLVVPGADHSLSGKSGEYAIRRIRSYFLEHLRGE